MSKKARSRAKLGGVCAVLALLPTADPASAATQGVLASAKRSLTLKFDPEVVRATAPDAGPDQRWVADERAIEPDLETKAGPTISVSPLGGADRDGQSASSANEQWKSMRNYLEELRLQSVSVRYTTKF